MSNANVKYRTSFCLDCSAERHGIKTRIAVEHTCGQSDMPDIGLIKGHSQLPQPQPAICPPLGDGGGDGGEHGRTIYIAGKVTGLPYKEVFKKFDDAQWLLEGRGWHVINPCLLCNETTEWQHAMRTCIAALTTAEAIYLLPDWKDSRGASIEVFLAGQIGLNIIHHNEMQ